MIKEEHGYRSKCAICGKEIWKSFTPYSRWIHFATQKQECRFVATPNNFPDQNQTSFDFAK